MSDSVEATPDLLQRWHQGDAAAMARLVELHLPWLQAHLERRLGAFLRERAEPADYLQDIVVEFLRDGPRFQVRDAEQFRRLLGCVAENTLRDRNDWYRAKRRDLGRNAPLPSESVLALDPAFATSETPSRVAAAVEMREWVRLALELLPLQDRRIILARDYDDRSFVDIGEEIGMTAAAVRMRWVRAVGRLADTMQKLRAGEVEAVVPGAAE